MSGANYWERLRRQRISRRSLLGGAVAAGVGAAGLTLVGCGEKEEGAGPTAVPTEEGYEPVGTRGGTIRYFGYDAMALDTYDPHQTQFGPLYSMHNAVFSGVLKYEDDVQETMYADLSAAPDGSSAMPEQPDEQTYIIRVRPTAKFHDTPDIQKNFPEVAGRAVTAEDVKYSIERQINPNSPQRALYYRRGQWETIDKIELVDDLTLRITTKGPIAPFLHYLADRNAHIIAKELVDENDEMNKDSKMIGSGPFILADFKALQHVYCVRNPEWFAKDDRPELGTDRPFMDSYRILWVPESPQIEETAFKTKQIEGAGFGFDYATLARVAQEMGDRTYVEIGTGTSGAPQTRFLLDRPPFDDFRRRKAIHLAVDRQLYGEQFFPSVPEITHFLFNGPIAWPQRRWAIPQDELVTLPGYRFGTAEREEDLKEARALWEAAGGNEAVGKFKLFVSGVPDFLAEKGLPQTLRMLKEVLGAEVETEVDPTGYTILANCALRNTEGAATGTCEYTLYYDNGWIDPDDWLYPYFHTGGSKNSYRLSDPKLDEMLEAQRAEFDFEKRHKIVTDIQHYFLDEILAHLMYAGEWGRSVTWNYTKNVHGWTWFGHTYWYANMWLDHNDPSFQGRPA